MSFILIYLPKTIEIRHRKDWLIKLIDKFNWELFSIKSLPPTTVTNFPLQFEPPAAKYTWYVLMLFCCAQIPKAKKTLTTWRNFYAFWIWTFKSYKHVGEIDHIPDFRRFFLRKWLMTLKLCSSPFGEEKHSAISLRVQSRKQRRTPVNIVEMPRPRSRPRRDAASATTTTSDAFHLFFSLPNTPDTENPIYLERRRRNVNMMPALIPGVGTESYIWLLLLLTRWFAYFMNHFVVNFIKLKILAFYFFKSNKKYVFMIWRKTLLLNVFEHWSVAKNISFQQVHHSVHFLNWSLLIN